MTRTRFSTITAIIAIAAALSTLLTCSNNPAGDGTSSLYGYTLTVNRNPVAGGTVTANNSPISGSVTYASKTRIDLRATATVTNSVVYEFDRWSGASTSADHGVIVYMTEDRNITANFIQTYTLTLNVNPSPSTAIGTVTATPSPNSRDGRRYRHGTRVTVTATPVNPRDYRFVRWEGASTSTDNTVTITMDNNKTLTAIFERIVYTLTINSATGGTTTPEKGVYTHYYGDKVTVTATPTNPADYSAAGWTGDVSSSSSRMEVTITGNMTITPVFVRREYTLTINSATGGTTSPAQGRYTHYYGDVVTVTATPTNSRDYEFVRWEGASTVTSPQITVTIYGNATLTPVFRRIEYRLDVEIRPIAIGIATVSRSPNQTYYYYGDVVTVTATPTNPLDYEFVGWSGASTATTSRIEVTITDNIRLTAEFKRIEYTLTVTPATGGTVSRNPNQATYYYGTQVNLTALPNPNYRFVRWTGASTSTTSPLMITIIRDMTITPVFELIPPDPDPDP